ncbi:DNA ligase 1 [Kluyveromyces marxianus]|uniref:DNA ligase n=1 Tax=Kluyveromyces marxianus TaxID=4911 RepID=A0ABX6EWG8_KLUMA|nr:DNA ligase 1 [Kluyveromyces marxianus]
MLRLALRLVNATSYRGGPRHVGRRSYSVSPVQMSVKRKQVTLDALFGGSKKVKSEVKSEAKPEVKPEARLEDSNSKVKNSTPTPTPPGSSSNAAVVSNIPFAELCDTFQAIEETSSRLAITAICSKFLYSVLERDAKSLVPVTLLFIHKLGPDYEPGLELGLGESLLIKTISEACGKTTQQIRNKYREIGDLGEIAMQARNVQPTMFKPKPLTVGEVFNNLVAIAKASGKDSQSKKSSLIKKMLTACKGFEAKFLIRSLESKLRIGLAEKTVLIAVSKAILTHEHKGEEPSADMVERAESLIRDAFCQIPNYEIIITTALEHGIMNLDQHIKLKPGIPLQPMLAKPTKSISEVLDRFQGTRFTCEYKYDGERAQVHLLSDGTMRIYSRNGEDMTERYPEINVSDYIRKEAAAGESTAPVVTSFILDSEAVAWDQEQNKILPFQVLSTRKRKGVELKDVKVRVCLFAFDILCLNDEPLINKSLSERRDILRATFDPTPGQFVFANEITTTNLDELQKYLDQSVKDSCEGLMVKMLDGEESHYEPSKRSRNWLKLKKDYLDGVGDSLDLVVLGAYYGRGKRTGTYGGFLLGCYNQDTEEFETCCKIGTGFSDEMLQTLYDRLQHTTVEHPSTNVIYDSSAPADVWFEPSMLFEVLTADLSLSPVYKAGFEAYGKGISLRFPRFVRIRDDKGVTDATSSDQVIEFYESQASVRGQ